MDNAIKRVPRSGWRWLLVLVVIQILLSVLYAVVVPPLEREDELIHWDYIRYLRTNGLPDQRDPYVQQNTGELHQPPVYYLIAALVTSPVPFSQPSIIDIPANEFGLVYQLQAVPDNANGFLHDPAGLAFPWQGDVLGVMLTRLLGGLLGAGATVALFWTAWLIFENQWWALGTAAWLGLRPSVIHLNAHLSNDPMVLLAAALVMMVAVLMVVRGITWKRSVLLGLLVGLMVMTKFTSAASAVAVPLAFVLAPGLAGHWRQRIGQLAAVVGSSLLVAGGWFVRNIVLYGDVIGMSLGNSGDRPGFMMVRDTAPDLADFSYHAWKAFREYWALFTAVGLPSWANIGLLAVAALLVVGLILLVARRDRQMVAHPRAGLFVASIAGLYLLQLGIMYVIITNGLKARYIYGGWPAMAVLMQLGWIGLLDALLPDQPGWQRWSALVPLGLMTALSLWAGFGILKPAYDLPHRVSDQARLAGQIGTPLDVQFGDTIHLIGLDAPALMRPGDGGYLTLCWQSLGPTAIPYAYGLHIVDADRFKAVERNTHPGLGMYPTIYWQPGESFCDRARITIDRYAPAPELYDITLRYFDPDTLERLPVAVGGEAVGQEVTIGHMAIVPRRWPEAGDVQYRTGDNLAITGLRLAEESLAPGGTLRVEVEWSAQAAIDVDYTAFVHVFGPDGALAAQTDSPPRGGRFPTRVWPRGAVVRDTIEVALPAAAAPGAYQVVFGMYDSATTGRLPLAAADGTPLPDNLVTIGTVDVR